MKAEAVLFTREHQVEFAPIRVADEPGPDEVTVRTKYSWISNGTEGSFLRGDRVDGVQPRLPGMPGPYPMVPGYQKAGIVEKIGDGVTGLQPGDWVFCTVTKLPAPYYLGFGGHVSIGPSDAEEVLPIPKIIDPIVFSGLVLTQVGYNSGNRGWGDRGETALVVGDGMVGLWTAQTLQYRGFRVALAGRHDARLSKFALRTGDFAVNTATEPDWLRSVADWSRNRLCIVADTVGNETNRELNKKLVELLKPGGHFIAAGHNGVHTEVDTKPLVYKEITLHHPCGWTRERLAKTIDLIAHGYLDTMSLITHRLPACEAAEAWRLIREERDRTLGVILEWP